MQSHDIHIQQRHVTAYGPSPLSRRTGLIVRVYEAFYGLSSIMYMRPNAGIEISSDTFRWLSIKKLWYLRCDINWDNIVLH